MLFKVALFYSHDFEFFKTAPFLGSQFLLSVAYNPANIQETRVLSIQEKKAESAAGFSQEDLNELLKETFSKFPEDHPCMAVFNFTSQLENMKWQKSSYFLDLLKGNFENAKSPQDDLYKAYEIAQDFLKIKNDERKLLAPQIPWTDNQASAHTAALKVKALRTHYNTEYADISKIIHEHDRKKKVLVHVCCGPDAAGVVQQLKKEFDVLCFWYDPNIQPKEEHDKRLDAFLKVVELEKVPAIVGEYNASLFLKNIKGLEHTPEQGAKCSICYDMRLDRAAIEAKKQNCDLFTTTLAISPHKVQQKLKQFGKVISEKYGIPYLARNYMKYEGFKESVQFTNENNIYRQDYCGCWFSLHEGAPDARSLADKRGLTPENIKSGHYNIEDQI